MKSSQTRFMMTAAVIATGMAFIDTTALNVALNSIRDDLAATNTQLLWTLNAYALALAALLLSAGSFSDRFGHRLVFASGVVTFATFSAACGSASSIQWLIFWRVFQGIGAAMMIPGSLILVCDAFPVERRGQAIGIWTGCSVVMMTIGPVVGGMLADQGWWRMIFFLNIGLSMLVLICLQLAGRVGSPSASQLTGPSADRKPQMQNELPTQQTPGHPIDYWGMVLASLGLGLTSFGFIQASELGWQLSYGVSIALGMLCVVFFWLYESRIEFPMLPVSLILKPEVLASCLIILVIYSAFHAMLVFIPLRLIQIDQFSALLAGVAQLPTLGGLILVSPLAGLVFDRYGAKLPLVFGIVTGAAGLALLAILSSWDVYWIRWFPGLMLLGIGLSFSITSLGTLLMNSVSVDRLGIASSLNSAVSRVASVVGVAVLSGFGFALIRIYLNGDPDVVRSEVQIQSTEYQEAFERSFVILSAVSAAMLAGSLAIVFWLLPNSKD